VEVEDRFRLDDPEIHQVDFGRVHDFGHRLMNDVVPGFEIMLL
jgi:hypothetical protein